MPGSSSTTSTRGTGAMLGRRLVLLVRLAVPLAQALLARPATPAAPATVPAAAREAADDGEDDEEDEQEPEEPEEREEAEAAVAPAPAGSVRVDRRGPGRQLGRQPGGEPRLVREVGGDPGDRRCRRHP